MSAREVTAIVGGAAWSNWTSYTVETDILTPAAAWSLEVANPTTPQIAAIEEGAAITLQVGTATVLTGWVDQKVFRSDRQGDLMTLTGRDFSAPLVDCSAPLAWASLRNVSLRVLATRCLAAVGAVAALVVDPAGEELLPRVHVDPGDTFWELLERHARDLRLMLWTSPPVGTLHRHVPGPLSASNNVVSAELAWKVSGRRSPVTVVGQSAGGDDLFGEGASKLYGKATDAGLLAKGLTRPLVVQVATASSTRKAKARARWEVEQRQGDAWVGTYTVPGHGPTTASVWDVDAIVNVLDDRAGILGPRWIAARRLEKSRQAGTQTVLTLRDLNAILPPV
jgi:prophage tail gpP-like protein